jgi:hypothetical protein
VPHYWHSGGLTGSFLTKQVIIWCSDIKTIWHMATLSFQNLYWCLWCTHLILNWLLASSGWHSAHTHISRSKHVSSIPPQISVSFLPSLPSAFMCVVNRQTCQWGYALVWDFLPTVASDQRCFTSLLSMNIKPQMPWSVMANPSFKEKWIFFCGKCIMKIIFSSETISSHYEKHTCSHTGEYIL